jgi:hypothetical protein
MQAEQIVGVGPGVDRAKAGSCGERAEFRHRVFIGIFGVDQFACGKAEALLGNPRLLVGEAADIDFDPVLGAVVERQMREPVEVEIAVELAVDPLPGLRRRRATEPRRPGPRFNCY